MKTRIFSLSALLFLSAIFLSGERASAVNVNVGQIYFSPTSISINTGDTVTWTWVGGFHTVTANDNSWDSGFLGTPATYHHQFNTAGQFPYYCIVHSTPQGSAQNGVINVVAPNAAPTVSISSPADGATFSAGETVPIVATAADADGSVASVEFFSNGVSLGLVTTGTYTVSLSNVTTGVYILTARATDNLGAVKVSSPVTISVGTPVLAPVISSEPQDLSRFIGDNATFTVGASGTPPLTFQWRVGGTNIAGAVSDTLVLDNLRATNAGGYSVVVSNAAGGAVSRVATLVVSPVPKVWPLQLQVTGSGHVAPNLNNRPLLIGRAYQLNAVPAAGNIFAGWTGDATQDAALLRFVMARNTTLTAHFIANPFLAARGKYTGSIQNTNTVPAGTNGTFVLLLNSGGVFSGAATLAGRKYPFAGRFDFRGDTHFAVLNRPHPPLAFSLHLDSSNAIAGQVGNNEFTNAVVAAGPPR